MKICNYDAFLSTIKKSTKNVQLNFILEAIKDLQSKAAFAVYFRLFELADSSEAPEQTLSISHEEIAKYFKMSIRTSARAICYLKAKGYIETVPSLGSSKGFKKSSIKVRYPKHLLEKITQSENDYLNNSGSNNIFNEFQCHSAEELNNKVIHESITLPNP